MESDRKDIIVNGTLEQYKVFVESVIWKDFQSNFEAWLSDIRDALESTENVQKLQGNAEAVRRVMNLPYAILWALRDQQYDNDQLGVEELENGEE